MSIQRIFLAVLFPVICICSILLGCMAENHLLDDEIRWSFDNVENRSISSKGVVSLSGVVKGRPSQTSGVFGSAIRLNGTYIEVPHNELLSLVDDFAIECVFKPFKTDGLNTLMWKGGRGIDGRAVNYSVCIRDGRVTFNTKDSRGRWSIFATVAPLVKADRWYNIFLVWKSGNLDIYVNGSKEKLKRSEAGQIGKCLIADNSVLSIGTGVGSSGSADYIFQGIIDEISIYRKIPSSLSETLFERELTRRKFYREELYTKLRVLASKLKEAGVEFDGTMLKRCSKAWDGTDELPESDILSAINDLKKSVNLLEKRLESSLIFEHPMIAESVFALGVLPAYERVVRTRGFFDKKVYLNQSITLSLAQNEYEGMQVLVLGKPSYNLKGVQVNVGTFKHKNGIDTLPESAIEWGEIKRVMTAKPDIPVECSGNIPDIIADNSATEFDVQDGIFTPLFFRFHANKHTTPGVYNGKITFVYDDSVGCINVKIRVYDFALPERSSIKAVFSFYEESYAKWYGLKSLDKNRKSYIYNWLLKYRITPNNIYSKAPSYPSVSELETLTQKGANFCTLKYTTGSKTLSDTELEKVVGSYREEIERLKEADLYKYTYFYSYDELGRNRGAMKSASQLLKVLRSEFPDLKCIQTSFPDKQIASLFNIWCPLLSYFASENSLELIMEAGDRQNSEIWWYVADSPLHPFPNFFLDYPVFDSRIIVTLSYMYEVKGLLYWSINREWDTNLNPEGDQWPEEDWNPSIISIFTGKRFMRNGMGNLVYPGPDGRIYPSLRIENLRDGLEDFEYYKLLEAEAEGLQREMPQSEITAKVEHLLSIPVSVARAVDDYSPNPKHLLEHREKIALLLEELSELKRASELLKGQ